MPGHATPAAVEPMLAPGLAHVSGGGEERRALTLLDSRPQTQFTRREEDEALEKLANVAGPATAGIVRRVSESFDAIRAELNERAGGQASDRVMTLAHNAQRAQLAVELQTTVSVSAHGRYVEAGGDKGQTEKGLSRLVGICAFATDLLNKAYEAAKAEAGSKASPTDQLMARIGVGKPAREVAPSPPVEGGGASTFGSLSSSITGTYESPVSIPPSPETPE